ncbi:zinc ribbon domain-containing protein [Symbiobacterium terraclitae]|uniref:zinc ribbon domain-containing protein n=1 Tax=Symbiobacterium terraclitae TaxID=557451 RepID=UPI0035B50517
MRKPQISPERKAVYYGGMGVMALGVLLFLSNFLIIPFSAPKSGPFFDPFSDPFAEMRGMALRGVGGIVLLMIGGFMMSVGVRGAAGSGLILDPEKAREDLSPWARTAGGLVKDALEEVRTSAAQGAPEPQAVVKVRCPQCRALNDEDARFCDQCGSPL